MSEVMIVRQATDDFGALLVSGAMQSLDGVDVVSVVHQMAIDGRVVWHVFAKFDKSLVSCDDIDAAIDAAYDA